MSDLPDGGVVNLLLDHFSESNFELDAVILASSEESTNLLCFCLPGDKAEWTTFDLWFQALYKLYHVEMTSFSCTLLETSTNKSFKNRIQKTECAKQRSTLIILNYITIIISIDCKTVYIG